MMMPDAKFENTRPDLCEIGPIDLCGVTGRLDIQNRMGVGNIWKDWGLKTVEVCGFTPKMNYGIMIYDDINTFTYFAGCLKTEITHTHPDFVNMHIPLQTCLNFKYSGPPAGMRDTIEDIWANRIPQLNVNPMSEYTVHKFLGVENRENNHVDVDIFVPLQPDQNYASSLNPMIQIIS